MENPGRFFVRRVLGLSLFSFFRSFAMLYGSFNVSLEKRVAEARIRGKFRMELYREEERMIVELHHLGQVFERGLGADDHTFFFELRDVGVVDFITVTMAFGHNIAVNLVRKRIGRNRHFLAAQTHRTAQI